MGKVEGSLGFDSKVKIKVIRYNAPLQRFKRWFKAKFNG